MRCIGFHQKNFDTITILHCLMSYLLSALYLLKLEKSISYISCVLITRRQAKTTRQRIKTTRQRIKTTRQRIKTTRQRTKNDKTTDNSNFFEYYWVKLARIYGFSIFFLLNKTTTRQRKTTKDNTFRVALSCKKSSIYQYLMAL